MHTSTPHFYPRHVICVSHVALFRHGILSGWFASPAVQSAPPGRPFVQASAASGAVALLRNRGPDQPLVLRVPVFLAVRLLPYRLGRCWALACTHFP